MASEAKQVEVQNKSLNYFIRSSARRLNKMRSEKTAALAATATRHDAKESAFWPTIPSELHERVRTAAAEESNPATSTQLSLIPEGSEESGSRQDDGSSS